MLEPVPTNANRPPAFTGDPWETWVDDLCAGRFDYRLERDFLGWQQRHDRWRVRDYRDQWHRLWVVDAGLITGHCGTTPLHLGPGDGAWLPAGATLNVDWPAELAFHEVLFSGDGPPLPGPLLVPAGQQLPDLIAMLATTAGPQLRRQERQLLGLALLDLLARRTWRPASVGGLDPERRERVTRWARAHLRQRPSPADLARVADLSPDWFARAFRHSFGRSPRRWLADERLRAAARRLREGGSIAETAAIWGYADLTQFNRAFRRLFGQPPGRWLAHGTTGP
jgi:AraC-like DNA-binding protein